MGFSITELAERYSGREAIDILLTVAKTVDWLQDVRFTIGKTGIGDTIARVTPEQGGDIITAMGNFAIHKLGEPATKTGASRVVQEPYHYFCLEKEIGIPVDVLDACPDDQRTRFIESEINNQATFLTMMLANLMIYGVKEGTQYLFKGLASNPAYETTNSDFVVDAGGSSTEVYDAWLICWGDNGCSLAVPNSIPGGIEVTYRDIHRVPIYETVGGQTVEKYQYQHIWQLGITFAPIVGIPGSIVRICNINPYGTSGGKLKKSLIHQAKAKLQNYIGNLQLLTSHEALEELFEDISLTPTLVSPTTSDLGIPVDTYAGVRLRKCSALGLVDKLTGSGSGGTPTEPELITVPNVVGMTQADAEDAIEEAGLTVGTVTQEFSDTVPEGQVVSQDPTAGTKVAPETAVNLEVSQGTAP